MGKTNKNQKNKNFFNNNSLIKNRKADISITILVLGVVAISILTIFSFMGQKNNVSSDFSGIGLIETMNSVQEEIGFVNKQNKFKLDYGNVFERGNVKINIENGEVKEGTFTKNGKIVVRVVYQK